MMENWKSVVENGIILTAVLGVMGLAGWFMYMVKSCAVEQEQISLESKNAARTFEEERLQADLASRAECQAHCGPGISVDANTQKCICDPQPEDPCVLQKGNP